MPLEIIIKSTYQKGIIRTDVKKNIEQHVLLTIKIFI
jgi:hypothetical protein